MTWTHAGRATGLLVASALLLTAVQTGAAFGEEPLPAASVSSPLRPNVLVIMADDQRHDPDYPLLDTIDLPDPNSPGKPWMAAVRKWFKEGSTAEGITGGVEFTRTLATTPLCCPSRASIFTGQYAHNTTVRQNEPAHGVTPTDPLWCTDPQAKGGAALDPCRTDRTLQHYIKNIPGEENLYRTAIFGKYLNGWDIDATDRDGDGLAPRPPADFDEYGIFNNGYTPDSYAVRQKIAGGAADTVFPSQYSTTYVRDQARNFIVRERSRLGPWLMFVHPWAPHHPPESLTSLECANFACMVEDRYRPTPPPGQPTLQVPSLAELGIDGPDDPDYPSYLESDVTDKPPFLRPPEFPCCAHPQPPSEESVERIREGQLRALKSVDDMVEAIFDEMNPDEQTNTLAFYLSDNGYSWGEHQLDGKRMPYTSAVRIPMYMRWPAHLNRGYASGITDRTADSYLRVNIDIAPTVMHALSRSGDIPADRPMDGRSLLAAAAGDDFPLERTARDHWLLEYWHDPTAQSSEHLCTYASNRWAQSAVYTEYFGVGPTPDYQCSYGSAAPPPCDATSCPSGNHVEHYDLDSGDPFERFNTQNDGNPFNDAPSFMAQRLQKDRRCKGQDRLVVEPPPCP